MFLKGNYTKVDAVPVPPELRKISSKALEDYVQGRINQLVLCLCQELTSHDQPSIEIIKDLSAQIAKQVPGAPTQAAPLAQRDLSLRFLHDCSALGCLDLTCHMCKDNPIRKCTSNFSSKYCVKDHIKAGCGSNIRIELVDSQTGEVVTENVPNLKLEVSILDGLAYKSKFLENGDLVEGTDSYNEELDRCAVLMDNKMQPLLTAQGGNASGANDASGRLVLSMQNGKAELVDVMVVKSSEALLSGRKPPFRLLAKAKGNTSLKITPIVSEAFVVNTRRARNDGKALVPLITDDVGKLDHMGKETVKKLQDLKTAALLAGEKMEFPDVKVVTVGDFKDLAFKVDQDATVKAKLLHILKLSKDKWEEAKEHAFKAVAMDNSMRGWTTKNQKTSVTLLFKCRNGMPDLSMPAAYTEKEMMSYPSAWKDDTKEILRQLAVKAGKDWHKPGHPSWMITKLDSDMFANGDINTTTIYNEGPMPTIATVTNTPVIQVTAPLQISPPNSTTTSGPALAGGNNGSFNDVSSVYGQQTGSARPGEREQGTKRTKPEPSGTNGVYGSATNLASTAGMSPSLPSTSYQPPTASFVEDTPFQHARIFPPQLYHPNSNNINGLNGRGSGPLEIHSPKDPSNIRTPRSPAIPNHPSPTHAPAGIQSQMLHNHAQIQGQLQGQMNGQGQTNPQIQPQMLPNQAQMHGQLFHNQAQMPGQMHPSQMQGQAQLQAQMQGQIPGQLQGQIPGQLQGQIQGQIQAQIQARMQAAFGWQQSDSLPQSQMRGAPSNHPSPAMTATPPLSPNDPGSNLQNDHSAPHSDWSGGQVAGNGSHINTAVTAHSPGVSGQEGPFLSAQEGSFRSAQEGSFLSAQEGSFRSAQEGSFRSVPESAFRSAQDHPFQSAQEGSFRSASEASFLPRQEVPDPQNVFLAARSNSLLNAQGGFNQQGLNGTHPAWNPMPHLPSISQPLSHPQPSLPFNLPPEWGHLTGLYNLDGNGGLAGFPHTLTLPNGYPLSSPMSLGNGASLLTSLPHDIKLLPSLTASLNPQAPSIELTDVDHPPYDVAALQQFYANFPQPPSCEMGESIGLLSSLVLEDEGELEEPTAPSHGATVATAT